MQDTSESSFRKQIHTSILKKLHKIHFLVLFYLSYCLSCGLKHILAANCWVLTLIQHILLGRFIRILCNPSRSPVSHASSDQETVTIYFIPFPPCISFIHRQYISEVMGRTKWTNTDCQFRRFETDFLLLGTSKDLTLVTQKSINSRSCNDVHNTYLRLVVTKLFQMICNKTHLR